MDRGGAMRAELLIEDFLIPVNQQQERAARDLLGHFYGDAPGHIACLHVGPWSMRELIAARRFSRAEVETLELSCLDGQTSALAKSEYDLMYFGSDLELLPSLRRLLPKIVKRLKVGGCLAAHFPNNLYEPNRALARMVAAEGPWAKRLLPVAKTRPFNETLEGLYRLLSPVCASVEIWETIYLWPLSGVGAIVDFMKATSLAPFLRPLDESARRAFLGRYLIELAQAYPPQPNGAVLLRFPRIFVLATR